MAIDIAKVSPSAINTFDMCQQKWLINYILGMQEPSGKAAVLGSCAHYVLEAVAKSKIVRQEGKKYREDKILGRIYPTYDVDQWVDAVYDHFRQENQHLAFANADRKQLQANVHAALAHKLSPENHPEIIAPEQYFTIAIDAPWARTARLVDGKLEEKQLYVNGIIDILFRDENGMLNYLDYKFGKPYDWAKGVEKDYSNLVDDIQLCLYYYAVKLKYPTEEIITNIWYVAANKLFVFNFGKETIAFVEERLRSVFEKIRFMESPLCRYGTHCRFCQYAKKSFDFWGKDDLNVPYHPVNHFRDVDGMSSVCDAIKRFIKHRGLTLTIENVKKKRGSE